MHICKQQKWDDEGRSLKAPCPILCQIPIQLLATIDSHSMLQNARVSKKSGLEKESSAILFYINASITLSKFPIWCKHKSKQPIWDEEGQPLKVHNPILCQCPIHLLATIDSHTMLPSRYVIPTLDWKRNLARDNRPTIDLKLIWNQTACLNASITLSKCPIMMQTQIQSTNMRWGGTTFKSSQPYFVPMPNTVIGNSWLSHNVGKQKCDDQIWTGRKIL